MSLYPVRLSSWYPKGDENYDNCKTIVKCASCYKCGKKKINYKYAIGYHSLPWGNGDVWCSAKCYGQRLK